MASLWHYQSEAEYRVAQMVAYRRKARDVWVSQTALDWLVAAISLTTDSVDDLVGICHGVRTGHENRRLQEMLAPRFRTVFVWGTELGRPTDLDRNIIGMDFHEEHELLPPAAAHFVYSNSLDHSYLPSVAIRRWLGQLAPGGSLYLHWSADHDGQADRTDCFRASAEEYRDLLAPFTGEFGSTELPAGAGGPEIMFWLTPDNR